MESTPAASVFMFVIASFLGAVGQYLYKTGASTTGEGLLSYILNPRILGGIVCYGAVMILFITAFKRGGSMAVLYPVYASTFIWGAIISYYAFGSEIKPVNIAGMGTMVLGMYLMGR